MFKYHKKLLPDIFNNFFTYSKEIHKYHTKSASLLRPPSFHLKLRKTNNKIYGKQNLEPNM